MQNLVEQAQRAEHWNDDCSRNQAEKGEAEQAYRFGNVQVHLEAALLPLEAQGLILHNIGPRLVVGHRDDKWSEQENHREDERDEDFGSQADQEAIRGVPKSRAAEHIIPFEVEITELTLIDPLATSPAPISTTYKARHIIASIKLVGNCKAFGACIG